jgi:HEPN domain-containing protein
MDVMQKNDHIDFWVQTALRDWEVANDLFQSGKYMYCLFFAHLTIEKLLKAHWLKDTGESAPPKVHSLTALHEKIGFKLPTHLETELPIITAWNLEARYQDYKDRFYKTCTPEYTAAKLNIVNELKECLIKGLQ